MAFERYNHLVLIEPPTVENFTSPPTRGNEKKIPPRNRSLHSNYLYSKLDEAWKAAEDEQAVFHATRNGVYIEFKGEPGFDLITKSLEDMRSKKVRLLNVRRKTEVILSKKNGEVGREKTTYATVYVAHEKKKYFFGKIKAYAEEIDKRSNNPKNKPLVESITSIERALVDSFWLDPQDLIPSQDPEWCEVWLSSHENEIINRFNALLNEIEIESRQGIIRFPERSVKVIKANREQLGRLIALSDDIAEFRLAKDTAEFWAEMPNQEQAEWVEELLKRIQVTPGVNVSICILDTGVNNGHPLLAPILADEDCQTVKPEWGNYDHDKHGTLMAGLAAYGDLREKLASNKTIDLRHLLESVKIIPLPPEKNKPELWGYITAQGVSLAEIQAPFRKRVICMAVAASDSRDQGRPSSWSGALDQIISDAENGGNTKRLFIVCTGNITDQSLAHNYPDAQVTDSVHDPAQAWNALTIGAYTKLDKITDPSYLGYSPIAPKDALSPYSTTSFTWDKSWPIKPEIVMEGGNMGHDGKGFVTECNDLSLISTFWKPAENYFYPFEMTSAAAAQAAWFAAQIQGQYPDFWPETIRALIVHSAEWTEALKKQFLPDRPKKTDMAQLIRICGYGVPNLERALYSASNSVTLIVQEELQPFDKKESGSGFKTKDIHLYDLPWPKEVLLELPDSVEVKMRITLSYFVEPGPGEIGWKDRYRYSSYGLRFDVNAPGEDKDTFRKRINKAALEDDEEKPDTQSASGHWVIGSDGRDKGSIHSDTWQGTAADLSESNIIAVYPVIGWWKERNYLGKWNSRTRYSLIVSILTPEENIDIYTPIANQIGIPVPITVET